MTRAINLYDGLEALYYFDSDYFDNGSNEISDQSGHGRHAEASGGPTVGVEGPRSFKATAFDGTDDLFSAESTFPQDHHSEFTIAVIVRTNKDIDINSPIVSFGNGDRTWFEYRQAFNNWDWAYNDVNGNYNSGPGNINVASDGTWEFLVGGFEPVDETSGYFRTRSLTTGGFSRDLMNDELQEAGGSIHINKNSTYSTAISFVAAWSRKLNRAEENTLGRLSAPRRSQL